MGMSWTEVHDEAEHLEHAVSDRLIERIDEMLGRPSVDPHGDPIPGPEGTLDAAGSTTRCSTCPLGETVSVRRVSDQDSDFLRFVERHELKPGQVVRVEARDDAADSVRLRGAERRIHDRRARRVEGPRAGVATSLLLRLPSRARQRLGSDASAGEGRPQRRSRSSTTHSWSKRRSIRKRHLSEHFGTVFVDGNWGSNFTQEWPLVSQEHQLSYTLSALDNGDGSGFGDMLHQLSVSGADGGPGRPAFSPRVSLVAADGRRAATPRMVPGLQVNLPFSKQTDDIYWHWNAGFTWLPRAESLDPSRTTTRSRSDVAVPGRQARSTGPPDVQPDARKRAALRRDSSTDGRHAAGRRVHAVAGLPRRLEHRRAAADRRRRSSHHLDRRRSRTPACSSISRTSCRSRSESGLLPRVRGKRARRLPDAGPHDVEARARAPCRRSAARCARRSGCSRADRSARRAAAAAATSGSSSRRIIL